MVQPGVVEAATISVLLTKYFLTVPCRRRRAPHHCGDQDPSRTIGRMSVVFWSHLVLRNSGKLANMALFQYLGKLLDYAPMIKAAIMRRGFICTSLTGVTSGTISSLHREHSLHRTSYEFWKSCHQTSHLRGIERPLALIIVVRPFVLCILLPALSDHSFDEIHVFFITK